MTNCTIPAEHASNSSLTWLGGLLLFIVLTASLIWQSGAEMTTWRSETRAGLAASAPLDELFDAVINGDPARVRTLIARGVDVNQLNRAGVSPLIRAAAGRRSTSCELVRLLIAAGADVNLPDSFGTSPLLYAVTSGNDEATAILLDAGANWNVRDRDGFTPRELARCDGNDVVIRLLDQQVTKDAGAEVAGATR